TAAGVDCFRNTRVISFTSREGLSSNEVNSVLASSDGRVLIGNHSALDILQGSKITSISARNGLPGSRITSLLQDHAGRIWVGIDKGLLIYDHDTFTQVKGGESNSQGIIIAITEDRQSNIWAAANGKTRVLLRIEGDKIKEKIPASKFPGGIVSLAPDPEEGIWLGLFGGL